MTSGRAPPGRPAGIVSRALAAAIDLGVVMVMGGGVLLTVAGVRFFLSPVSFHWRRRAGRFRCWPARCSLRAT
jgi:hypothetical protein